MIVFNVSLVFLSVSIVCLSLRLRLEYLGCATATEIREMLMHLIDTNAYFRILWHWFHIIYNSAQKTAVIRLFCISKAPALSWRATPVGTPCITAHISAPSVVRSLRCCVAHFAIQRAQHEEERRTWGCWGWIPRAPNHPMQPFNQPTTQPNPTTHPAIRPCLHPFVRPRPRNSPFPSYPSTPSSSSSSSPSSPSSSSSPLSFVCHNRAKVSL